MYGVIYLHPLKNFAFGSKGNLLNQGTSTETRSPELKREDSHTISGVLTALDFNQELSHEKTAGKHLFQYFPALSPSPHGTFPGSEVVGVRQTVENEKS